MRVGLDLLLASPEHEILLQVVELFQPRGALDLDTLDFRVNRENLSASFRARLLVTGGA